MQHDTRTHLARHQRPLRPDALAHGPIRAAATDTSYRHIAASAVAVTSRPIAGPSDERKRARVNRCTRARKRLGARQRRRTALDSVERSGQA